MTVISKIRIVALAALLGFWGKAEGQTFVAQMPAAKRQWASAGHVSPLAKHSGKARIVEKGDSQLGPANSFGTLYGPDGTEWIYTATFDHDGERGYTAAHMKIYDSQNKLVGTVDNEFTLAEHQTSVNSVMIDPNVTQKFFNVNDKYEVILFVHATTDDYQGCVYQKVFSLEPGQTEELMTIPGYEVLIADMASDQWSEKKQMVMMREEVTDDKYYIHYDVYDRAGWGSLNAPVLLHTFTFDYEHISGSGGNASPIAIQCIGGKAHYAVSYYEKPCLVSGTSFLEDPVQTPDNNFIIDLYDIDCFDVADGEEAKPYKTIKIPVEKEEGYLYTFPGLCSFMGNDDFSVGLFGDDSTPYFLVTTDNYETGSDDFFSSVYLYDQEGVRVKTIATGISDYLRLADIPGHGPQFCFTDNEEEKFRFLELPSCEYVAEIPYIADGHLLSLSLDRVPASSGYNYVISGSTADLDEAGNILHPIGYFSEDGSTDHWDMVNLGPDVVMAQPAIISEWLSPYLFNTDNDREYMFLVKLPSPDAGASSRTEEHLWVMNAKGEKLVDFAPDAAGVLNSISVMNAHTSSPALSVAYYDWQPDEYTLSFLSLPIEKFAGGTGSEVDPYVITNAGDLMQISKNPNAYYVLGRSIDAQHYPIAGNKCEFGGSFDGQGYFIKNLNVSGSGLLGDLVGSAKVKDVTFFNPTMTPEGSYAGIVASTARYNGSDAPLLSHVYVRGASVADDQYDGYFGSVIGQLTTGSSVVACAATDADINLPRASVGGLVGEVTASGGVISASAFQGAVFARVAGGMVGEVTSVTLRNAHVNADIFGQRVAGGVVGEVGEYNQERGTFRNCYVEGNVGTQNSPDAYLGGIAGAVEEGANKCITNNVVALDEICILEDIVKGAHRIVGHSCADNPGVILWEDPWWNTFEGDPYAFPELWPRAEVTPDKGFEFNYAVYPLAPVNGDAIMAEDHTSVEGQTVNEADSEAWQSFFAKHDFLFGEDVDNPWTWNDGEMALWYEVSELAGIRAAEATKGNLQLADGRLTANGMIEVYTFSGMCVATGRNAVPVASLHPGVYIAKCGSHALKFIVK